jgi:hypothetical protein
MSRNFDQGANATERIPKGFRLQAHGCERRATLGLVNGNGPDRAKHAGI